MSELEAQGDDLRSQLAAHKQGSAEQLATAKSAREAASTELSQASEQLQAAQTEVARLQGRVSELDTSLGQSRSAEEASNKALAAAKVHPPHYNVL